MKMKWYNKYLSVYGKPFSQAPSEVVAEVKENIQRLQSPDPLITVSIIAYNEEKHLLACLWSLSEMRCKYPVEIIGVNNDSADRTADIFEQTGVPFETEYRHSCGYARRCGLNRARGTYHINIDADTIYPPQYVELMTDALRKDNNIAVSAFWGYIPDSAHPKWILNIYEGCRDIYLRLQAIKRPELSIRGLVFAYHTGPARKIGIRVELIRGEDGSLAFELKKQGNIGFVRDRRARPLTGYGTIQADGGFSRGFILRVSKALRKIGGMFTKKKHYPDTDTNLIGNKNKKASD